MTGAARAAMLVTLAACGRVEFDPLGEVRPPIARYLMDDDPVNGVVADATGNGHDGACTTCPTVVPAVDGGGFEFAGGELIHIAYGPDFDTRTGASVAAWVRPDTTGGCIASKLFGTAEVDAWQLCLNEARGVFGCAWGTCDGTGTLEAGTWRQLVLAVDNKSLRVWFGGELVGDMPATGPNDDGELIIGGDLDAGALVLPFTGVLDDVRIWNVALTAREVGVIVAP
jgi:Concanavalin A-like lectin/glucanases superfamily